MPQKLKSKYKLCSLNKFIIIKVNNCRKNGVLSNIKHLCIYIANSSVLPRILGRPGGILTVIFNGVCANPAIASNKNLSTWELSLSCEKRTQFALTTFSSLFRPSWVDCEWGNFLLYSMFDQNECIVGLNIFIQ